MTALHEESSAVGRKINIHRQGQEDLIGEVAFSICHPEHSDIAVIRLNSDSKFQSFIPIAESRVTRGTKIAVLGWKNNVTTPQVYNRLLAHSEVNVIEEHNDACSLFEANYTGFNGLSGGGVVSCLENNIYKVVGVHTGANDETEPPPSKKKCLKENKNATVGDVMSLSESIHGHQAYCLVCEAIRVEELMSFLQTI